MSNNWNKNNNFIQNNTDENMTSHYDILGVKQDATDVEIKKSFRRLSLELHPDRNKGDDDKYQKVVEAYSILGDKEKRGLYDISLKEKRLTRLKSSNNFEETECSINRHQTSQSYRNNYQIERRHLINPNSSHSHSSAFDDYGFENTVDDFYNFRDMNMNMDMDNERNRFLRGNNYRFERNSYKQDKSQETLEDIQHTVHITLEEAYMGVSLPIKIDRRVNGVSEQALVYIDIPQGTDNGEIIILEGKGHLDAHMRMRSHVRVKVLIDEHPIFRRDRLNVIYNLDITLKEALCGFRKEISHIDGRTYLISSERGKIITQGGRRCITGKGFQRGQTMGNLIIVFNIVMPKSLTMEQIQNISKIL